MNDEVYYSRKGNALNLLRFYSIGVVIGAPVYKGNIKNISNMLSWFNLESYKPHDSKGTFQFDGKNISFELTSSAGTVIYKGELKPDNSLILHSHSLINGHKAERKYLKYNRSDPKTLAQIFPPDHSTGISSRRNRLLAYLFMGLVLTGCFTCATRKRSGCRCRDGFNSSATGPEACSSHGGVKYWKHTYWWN